MSLPKYDLGKLKSVLRSNRIMVLAVCDDKISPNQEIKSAYDMRAMVLDLEQALENNLEIACIDNTSVVLELNKANSHYSTLFIGLSATANILTIEGWDIFYIPRRPGQTMPPEDVRLFDPSQDRPAYHICSYKSVECNFAKLAKMSNELII